MPNDYCTTDEVKAAMPDALPSTDTSYNSILSALITRASRMFDRETKRAPGAYAKSSSDTETRYYDGSGTGQQWVDEMAAAPTSVKISEVGSRVSSDYTTISSSDYTLYPYNAALIPAPYTRIDLDTLYGAYSYFPRYPRSIEIVAPFGFTTTDNTPDDIVQATIVQTIRMFKRGQQAFQDVGAITALGQLRYVGALDPMVQEVINLYKRVTI